MELQVEAFSVQYFTKLYVIWNIMSVSITEKYPGEHISQLAFEWKYKDNLAREFAWTVHNFNILYVAVTMNKDV